MRAIVAILAIFAILALAGCSAPPPTATLTPSLTASPTATPTPKPTATPTATPESLAPGPTVMPTATLAPRTPAPIITGISRQQAYDRLKALSIGLLPLDRHMDDFYSTRLPDGGIVIDIFGTSTRVEAIESTFRLPEVAAKMDPVVGVMLEIALGDDWGGGYQWVLRSIEALSETNVKAQTIMNGVYLTLYFISSIDAVMFTVDMERQ